jgi:hypothetical protein
MLSGINSAIAQADEKEIHLLRGARNQLEEALPCCNPDSKA